MVFYDAQNKSNEILTITSIFIHVDIIDENCKKIYFNFEI